jgi:hypothetical protein
MHFQWEFIVCTHYLNSVRLTDVNTLCTMLACIKIGFQSSFVANQK